MGRTSSDWQKTTKANPLLNCGEDRPSMSLAPTLPPWLAITWSDDDKVWSILLMLLYHTASQKAMPGSAGPSTSSGLALRLRLAHLCCGPLNSRELSRAAGHSLEPRHCLPKESQEPPHSRVGSKAMLGSVGFRENPANMGIPCRTTCSNLRYAAIQRQVPAYPA